MHRDWLFAAGIIAIPILLFGLIELVAYRRRQRAKAVAQRSKRRSERPQGARSKSKTDR